MQNNNTPGTIFTNTNRVIGSTQADWKTVKKGSLVQFGEEKVFYTINGVEDFFYIKPFEKFQDFSILVDGASKNLVIGDEITLTYKEYYAIDVEFDEEAFPAAKPTSLNHAAFSEPILLGKDGEISNPGRTTEKVQFEGVKVTYATYENRKMVKYSVTFVDNETVTLNKDLPKNVQEGKISCSKSVLYLATTYIGKTLSQINFKIIRDFTPNLQLPLMPAYGPMNGALVNVSLKKLDMEIQNLKKRLGG